MIKKLISLSLEYKLILFSLIVILSLFLKNFKKKRKITMLQNKILWLETKNKKEGETKLSKLTKEYLELVRNEENPDDFDKWIEEAETGDWYHFKNKN